MSPHVAIMHRSGATVVLNINYLFLVIICILQLIPCMYVNASNAAPIPSFQRIYASNIFTGDLATHTNTPIDQTIQGSMQYFPSAYAGTSLPPSNRSDFMITVNVMLPHSGDDLFGCETSGPWNRTNEFGQDFSNAFVLIQVSPSCGTQFIHAQQAGVLGFLVMGCPSTPPYSWSVRFSRIASRLSVLVIVPQHSNCDSLCCCVAFSDPGLTALSTLVPGVTVPLLSITEADGTRILHYLQAKRDAAILAGSVPPPDTLTITLKSSGPIVPYERAALISIMQQAPMGQFAFGAVPSDLPMWSVERFQNMSLDPCLDRPYGLWCEGGHVVYVAAIYVSWITPTGIPEEFGLLSKMKYFNTQVNFWTGAFPASTCNWTDLRGLWIGDQITPAYITSVPDCEWPLLEEFEIFFSALTTLPPSFSNWTNLRFFFGFNNSLTALPPVDKLTKLETFSVAFNQLTGSFPNFSPVAPLTTISLAGNQFSGVIPINLFDGLSTLEVLDLSGNQLSGPLPSFIGCTSLSTVDLSQQRPSSSVAGGFTGSMPSSWSGLTKMKKLYLQQNSLISPFTTSVMSLLEELDLSHNYLTILTPGPDAFRLFIVALVSPSLKSLGLSFNQLSGPVRQNHSAFWDTTDPTTISSLRKLFIDHNQLTKIMPELFLTGITILDASYNNLTQQTDGSDWSIYPPIADWSLLNLQGNPYLIYNQLPVWIVPLSTKIQQSGDTFLCNTFKSNTAPLLSLQVDPTFHKYKYCDCVPGTFGRAPLCSAVPSFAELNPFQIISSDEIGSTFPTLVQETGGVGGNLKSVVNPTNISVGFSDNMYGGNRLTLGMSTSWVVNLKDLYGDDIDQYELVGLPQPKPIQIHQVNVSSHESPPIRTTSVRMITVRLHISATVMTSFDDVLSIYEGGSDLKGTRVYTIRGTDSKPELHQSNFTMASEYLAEHNSSISLIQDPRLVEIQVFSSDATIQFTSRAQTGLHFYSTYSYDFTCPIGYFYDTVSDPLNPKCRSNYLIFQIGPGIRSAVYGVSGLTLGCITINIIILLWKWDSLVFKAASRSFMLLILVLLECMGLGALLYAAIPSSSEVGQSVAQAICHGRVWLTCLPLSGILAVLFAKNNRLDSIFGSTKLQVKVHTDFDILKIVLGVCSSQILLLCIFSGLHLTQPELVLGKGSLTNRLVYQCSEEVGFLSWLGAQIACISALMLGAAYLGFRTRDLPSQFNESAHIQNAVILLIFFLVIIVPLDIFIQDDPGAAVLIQGLGQAFLTLVLLGIIFGPKLYYLNTTLHGRRSGPVNTQLTHASGNGNGKSGRSDSGGIILTTNTSTLVGMDKTSHGSQPKQIHHVQGRPNMSAAAQQTQQPRQAGGNNGLLSSNVLLSPPNTKRPSAAAPYPIAVIPPNNRHPTQKVVHNVVSVTMVDIELVSPTSPPDPSLAHTPTPTSSNNTTRAPNDSPSPINMESVMVNPIAGSSPVTGGDGGGGGDGDGGCSVGDGGSIGTSPLKPSAPTTFQQPRRIIVHLPSTANLALPLPQQ